MLFVVSKLLQLLCAPGSLLLLIGLAGLPWAWRGRTLGLAMVSLSIGGLTLILALPLNQWLLLPLEDRFPPPAPPPAEIAGIILLGSAEEVEMTQARGLPSFNDNMETVTAFVSLARRYPAATLAFSGGTGAIAGNLASEADVVRALLEQLGFDRKVTYENTSRDTYENAVQLKRIVQPAPGTVWLLVTAASHMPRSVGCFEAVGWPVVAWPVAYKSAASAAVQFRRIDLGSHLSELDTALHEWVGLLAYRLMGRTSTLFPVPPTAKASAAR